MRRFLLQENYHDYIDKQYLGRIVSYNLKTRVLLHIVNIDYTPMFKDL